MICGYDDGTGGKMKVDTKDIIATHAKGNMNICAKFCANPCSVCGLISVDK